eukprot:TRINITY_DN96541_c0_g1_i1.p1 TRINITY_DN96541_c0_g1~~TRINITY_DN96541_c0_g1_i1.p1  ORF type:complete len:279 (-),score=-3.75 TRINITY_DN96541_c0_g1_i1:114-950(-)
MLNIRYLAGLFISFRLCRRLQKYKSQFLSGFLPPLSWALFAHMLLHVRVVKTRVARNFVTSWLILLLAILRYFEYQTLPICKPVWSHPDGAYRVKGYSSSSVLLALRNAGDISHLSDCIFPVDQPPQSLYVHHIIGVFIFDNLAVPAFEPFGLWCSASMPFGMYGFYTLFPYLRSRLQHAKGPERVAILLFTLLFVVCEHLNRFLLGNLTEFGGAIKRLKLALTKYPEMLQSVVTTDLPICLLWPFISWHLVSYTRGTLREALTLRHVRGSSVYGNLR